MDIGNRKHYNEIARRVIIVLLLILITVASLPLSLRAYAGEASQDDQNGLVIGADGITRLYRDGKVRTAYNGLYENTDGRFYYLRSGVWQSGYTGLYEHSKNGRFYYLKNGIWDSNYNGLYEHSINHNFYYLRRGIWQSSYTGLYEHSINHKFYYLKNGIWQKGYVGLYKHSINGRYYYLHNGIWYSDYTGIYNNSGTRIFLQRGMMQGAEAKMSEVGNSPIVLVSLESQHLWYYKGGNLILSTPIVSGDPVNSPTYKGTFYIQDKSKNARLIGPTWDRRVSYWLGIDSIGKRGLHDARWQSEFGGSVYLSDGSHGCINMPLDAIAILFSDVSMWTKVVVY